MYVKIESWHILKGGEEGVETLCGKEVSQLWERAADFGNEKTCESCFRIAADHEPDPETPVAPI
jgi:hypothetical protein